MTSRSIFLFLLTIATSCYRPTEPNSLSIIQIQDRNGLTETISNQERLAQYQNIDFAASQPYKKVQRVFRANGKSSSIITTYHPNGAIWQYLEVEEMRAHGAYREWFANGTLKIEATVIGGPADITPAAQEGWLFDSVSSVWDEAGHLLANISYENGRLEGPSIYYYPSGQIEKEVPFSQNEIDGEFIEYLSDGTVKCKTHYAKGIKEGASFGFFCDGKPYFVEHYSHGLLQTGIYYNASGDVVSQVEKGQGTQTKLSDQELILREIQAGVPEGIVQQFTLSGELRRSHHTKNGKKHGEEIEYFSSKIKRAKLSVNWHENMIHGSVKTWYDNGQIHSQREYARNQKSGPCLAWYRNGQLMLLEEYEEDQLLSGKYYKISQPNPVSSVIHGNGLATLYDETGALLSKIQYFKGKPIDPEK